MSRPDSPIRRYGAFGLLALGCGYLAWRDRSVAWAWLASSFAGVCVAYAGVGPGLLGKRRDGGIAPWSLLLWLPYFALTWSLWHLGRLVKRGPRSHEIVDGLWLGVWPDAASRLPEGCALIVDLTSEFPRRAFGPDYLCLPTLDADAPTPDALAEGVAAIERATGPVYVHCAAGHGRSATLVAAVLMARGLAADVDDAEAFLKRIRPGVRLTPPQRRLLERTATQAAQRPRYLRWIAQGLPHGDDNEIWVDLDDGAFRVLRKPYGAIDSESTGQLEGDARDEMTQAVAEVPLSGYRDVTPGGRDGFPFTLEVVRDGRTRICTGALREVAPEDRDIPEMRLVLLLNRLLERCL